ncbi:hypothetical protein OBBRIDRAFT_794317 [Obba rivulosa]|uniref:Uncharacterized protein n=1 Tax=Obba rivulosa TaxID=1052685 RepID=A0A8E2AS51_9APHY|nr:hypothetical protein OBBRIDRAFT_794317 [Obba rivulosa]
MQPSQTSAGGGSEMQEYIGEAQFNKWLKNPSLPEDHLTTHVTAMLELIKTERLQGTGEYVRCLELKAQSASATGSVSSLATATQAYEVALSTQLGVTSPCIGDRLSAVRACYLKRPANRRRHQS